MKDNLRRVSILDNIRGGAVILMIIYHTCVSIIVFRLFENAEWLYRLFVFFDTVWFFIIWSIVIFFFFTVAGVTTSFSRSNLRRALYCLGAALLLNIATWLFTLATGEDLTILFGILHAMGSCMLIYWILQKLKAEKFIHKLWPLWLLLFVLAFFICFDFSSNPIGNVKTIEPVYLLGFKLPLDPIGFPTDAFIESTADYFGIFPWLFAFLFGASLGPKIRDGKFPKWFYKAGLKPLSFAGRHTVIIYLLHQPVIIGILFVIDLLI